MTRRGSTEEVESGEEKWWRIRLPAVPLLSHAGKKKETSDRHLAEQ